MDSTLTTSAPLHMTNAAIVRLYEYWSEMEYSASFLSPSEGNVAGFRRFLASLDQGWDFEPTDDESELLAEFKRQEQKERTERRDASIRLYGDRPDQQQYRNLEW